MANILVVDDEKNMRRSLSIAMSDWGHEVDEAESGERAVEMVKKEVYDIVITDLVMEKMDGIMVLKKVKELSPYSEVILMSAYGTISKAVEAMRQGAYDFVVKPFSMDHLEVLIKKLQNQMELKKTVKTLKSVLADRYPFNDIVAVSKSMREVLHHVSMISEWSVPVLIQGESGVGKELVAGAIHNLSERREKPFVAVNCGAFPETLLDSELFGHCRGAFTGATVNKRGLIEEADGGTLFLDEIGEAPNALQLRLLRFLDNGKFRRIGEVVERQSDVRIIAATNRALKDEIDEGRFREDLYFRLSVAVIDIPPLRERQDDILALTQWFLEKCSKRMKRKVPKIHPDVNEIFMKYRWPGNVRELENTIEHLLVLNKAGEIGPDDLPPKFKDTERQIDKSKMIEENMPLHELEKRYILSVLKKTDGNKKRAAEILKISRTTLISRLKTYGIEIKPSTK